MHYFLSINLFLIHSFLYAEEYKLFETRRKQAEEKKERIAPAEIVRLNIPFSACLEAFVGEEVIEQFYSGAIKSKTNAIK